MKQGKLLVAVITVLMISMASTLAGQQNDADANFDRLDGRGSSGKRVDVIEWEGNLEIHVYPKGSLKGLALTIDRAKKDRPVMVIGYRFSNSPSKQLVRRNILSIPMTDNFKAYWDKSASDYDKVVISNNGLSQELAELKLDPALKLLYPDEETAQRAIASQPASLGNESASGGNAQPEAEPKRRGGADQDGTIQPFKW